MNEPRQLRRVEQHPRTPALPPHYVFVVRLRVSASVVASATLPEATSDRLLHQLSPSERELAQLVCAGLTNKEIAVQLRKTEGSVKVQLSGVFQKLRVNSRAKLIVALR